MVNFKDNKVKEYYGQIQELKIITIFANGSMIESKFAIINE